MIGPAGDNSETRATDVAPKRPRKCATTVGQVLTGVVHSPRIQFRDNLAVAFAGG
jgi:hypothetical protein